MTLHPLQDVDKPAETEEQGQPELRAESLQSDIGWNTTESIRDEENAHCRVPVLRGKIHVFFGAEKLDIAYITLDQDKYSELKTLTSIGAVDVRQEI